MDDKYMLYQWNPITYNVTTVGSVNCTSYDVASLSLQRNGIIWGLDYNGTMFQYNIGSKQCLTTNFIRNQSGILLFTMTFVTNDRLYDETIYGSDFYYQRLAKIDPKTLSLSTVGNFSGTTYIEDLTASSDGRLFGIVSAPNYTIAEIDKTNANIIRNYTLNISRFTLPSYGFAAYGSNFLVFPGNGSNYTDLYLYMPSDNSLTKLANYALNIIGAYVSSCFGTS